jgi:hypothetical protein
MKMRCFGCDIEKDLDISEIYPYEYGLADEPIQPLFVLDCQGPRITNDPNGYSEYRMVVVCHACFHILDPDMWISEGCWKAINPKIPYDKLPMYIPDLEDITLLKPL